MVEKLGEDWIGSGVPHYLENILTLDTCFMENVFGNVLWGNGGNSENIGLMPTNCRVDACCQPGWHKDKSISKRQFFSPKVAS